MSVRQAGFLVGFRVDNGLLFLRRGVTWQTDSYPTPGSLLRGFTAVGVDVTPMNQITIRSGWPFKSYQDNMRR